MENVKYFIYAAITLTVSITFLYIAITTPFATDGRPEKAEGSFLMYSVGIMSLLLSALFLYQGIMTRIKKRKRT